MTTDRRQQILRLYHLALAREADDREAFLAQVCAGDDNLRHDVESLLAQDPPEHFLESPAMSAAVVSPFADQGGVLVGRQIGAYRVDSRLESGGLGDVRFAGSIARLPPTMSSSSGRSFATVRTVFTRDPRSTPKMLIAANTT